MPTPFYQDPTLPQGFSITFRDRFWKKVNKNGPVPPHRPELGQCWIWTAWICSSTGYGGIQAGERGMLITAHEASWIIHHQPVQAGHYICHHCDNRPCVRPEHLFEGTPQDNHDDMWAKGRGPVQKPHESHFARLTWDQVNEIRRLSAEENLSHAELGRRFSIDRGAICRIIHNKCWKVAGPTETQQP